MSLAARGHLLADSAFRGLLRLRRRQGSSSHEPGASLPGGQAHLSAVILDPDGPDPVLRTGNTKHSLWRTIEWRLMRDAVGPLPAPVLDLGCGDGSFGAMLRPRVDIGVDGDEDAVSRCDPAVYGEAYAADIRATLPVESGSLAAVFSNSTLEHVTPLAPALREVARMLRPDGELVATVPSLGLWRALAARFGDRFAERFNAGLSHHNLWDWARWRDELQAAGLEPVAMRGYFSDAAACWYATRSLVPWEQLARRRPQWLWQHDLTQLRRLAAQSLDVTDEDATCCLLLRARPRRSSRGEDAHDVRS